MKQKLLKRVVRTIACATLAAVMTVTVAGCDRDATKKAAEGAAESIVDSVVADVESEVDGVVKEAKDEASEAISEASSAVENALDEAKDAKEEVESAVESAASEVKEEVQGAVEEIGKGATKFFFDVVNADGTEKKFEVSTDLKTVGEALLEVNLIAGDDSEYGLYVKTVDGVTVDYDKDGAYWAFYVNGEYASTGVDSTEITDGATYSFKVEK